MYKIKNIVRKPAVLAAAIFLALCCALPATALAGDDPQAGNTATAVSSLTEIADGYDASGSGVTYEIVMP